MSLLMDALRKAEESKKQAAERGEDSGSAVEPGAPAGGESESGPVPPAGNAGPEPGNSPVPSSDDSATVASIEPIQNFSEPTSHDEAKADLSLEPVEGSSESPVTPLAEPALQSNLDVALDFEDGEDGEDGETGFSDSIAEADLTQDIAASAPPENAIDLPVARNADSDGPAPAGQPPGAEYRLELEPSPVSHPDPGSEAGDNPSDVGTPPAAGPVAGELTSPGTAIEHEEASPETEGSAEESIGASVAGPAISLDPPADDSRSPGAAQTSLLAESPATKTGSFNAGESVVADTKGPQTGRGKRQSRQKTARKLFAAKKQGRRQKQAQTLGFAAVVVMLLGTGGYFAFQLMQPRGGLTVNLDPQFSEPPVSLPAEPASIPSDGAAGAVEEVAVAAEPADPATAPGDIQGATVAQPEAVNGTTLSEIIGADSGPDSGPRDAPEEPADMNIPNGQTTDSLQVASRGDSALPAGNTLNPGAVEEGAATQGSIESLSTSMAGTASTELPDEPVMSVSFTRSESRSEVNPDIAAAYSAFVAGDFDQSSRYYISALQEDPYQRDALLGLAAISLRRDDNNSALEYYSRLLARNPEDPVARAALLDLLPVGSVAEQELELKRLINRHATVAALPFALGNLYAGDGRWRDAQVQYFQALQLARNENGERLNPDYAFNLAVSLERIAKPELAATYYRQALDQAEQQPPGFDPAVARTRLQIVDGYANQ